MNAYHLFREKGAFFVYHLDAGRFIRVSPAAYELLELRGAMSAADAEAAFRARHPDASGVLKDVAALEAEGFFEPADAPVKDEGEFEAELDERFSGPCNTDQCHGNGAKADTVVPPSACKSNARMGQDQTPPPACRSARGNEDHTE